MKNLTVTRVGITSIGKLVGTVNAILALAIGIVAAITAIITYVSSSNDGFFTELIGSVAIGLGALIIYPLIAFALGWLIGVLYAFIFNVVIGVSGGVELTVEEEAVKAKR